MVKIKSHVTYCGLQILMGKVHWRRSLPVGSNNFKCFLELRVIFDIYIEIQCKVITMCSLILKLRIQMISF